MADVTNELMYELSKKIHFRLDKIDAGIDELRHSHGAMRGHMISIQTDISNIYASIARHDDRFDRIERRLELRELAEAQAKFDRDK
nr:hypothetical protein [Mesorhizobium sp. J18]